MTRLLAYGFVVLFGLACFVTWAGGGIDDPAGGTCTAGSTAGCNPEVGVLHIFGEKRCVRMQGGAWGNSPCDDPKAVLASATGDGPATVDGAHCGLAGEDQVLGTIRTVESASRYGIGPNSGGASGAYQFIQSTWNSEAAAAGRPDLVGTAPYRASPADQDLVARQYVAAALASGGVETVGPFWYLGHVPAGREWDVVPHPEAGNTQTPRQYQALWLAKYRSLGGSCAA